MAKTSDKPPKRGGKRGGMSAKRVGGAGAKKAKRPVAPKKATASASAVASAKAGARSKRPAAPKSTVKGKAKGKAPASPGAVIGLNAAVSELPRIPDLGRVEELLAVMDSQVLPGIDQLVEGAGGIIGDGCAAQIGKAGVAMRVKAREAIYFFREAAKIEDPALASDREMLINHGVARLTEALAHQSSLSSDLALQMMYAVMSPTGMPTEKIRTFQIGAPAYFPKLIHTLASMMRTKIGVAVSDWEALHFAALFSIANVEQFCAEPYISRRFGMPGAGRAGVATPADHRAKP